MEKENQNSSKLIKNSRIPENIKPISMNQKAVSRQEVSKIIDNFIILNKIIEVNIGGDFPRINSDDLNAFKTMIFELNKNFSKENFEYVLNSTRKLEIKEEDDINLIRDSFCKYLILLISYLIHYWHQMKSNIFIENILLTLKLIKKLFIEKILSEKEVIIIIKILLLMSLYTTIFTDDIDRRGKNIKYVLFIWLGISFLTSLFNKNNENIENTKNENKSNNYYRNKEFNLSSNEEILSYNIFLGEILNFFNKMFLLNPYNISVFSDSIQYLSLLEILKYPIINEENKEKIVFVTVKIYGNKFDSKILGFLMKLLRECLVDFSNLFYQKFYDNNFSDVFSTRKSVLSKNYQNLKEKNENEKTILNFDIEIGSKYIESENKFNKFNLKKNYENTIIPIVEHDLKILDSILFFLQKCFSEEIEDKIKNNYKFKKAFMLSNSGISLNPIISFPSKGYTLIFSFKWIPENTWNIGIENYSSKRMDLLSFIREKELENTKNPKSKKEQLTDKELITLIIMSIYIEDNKLFLSNKETQLPLDLNFSIKPYTTYVVNICHIQPGILSLGKSKIHIMINNNFSLSTEISGYPSGKVKCLMGCGVKYDKTNNKLENYYHFSGEMGSTILFNEVFSMDVINKIIELKTDYEKILYRNYEYHGPTNDKELTRVLNYFKTCEKYKFEQLVVMIISPRAIVKSSVLSPIPKTFFKENYLELNNNKKITMINRKIEFLSFINICENKSFVNEFVKLDGIKFLSLIFISLYQISDEIMMHNNSQIMEDIDIIVEKILNLVSNLLDFIDINYYISSLDHFFYYMDSYFSKVNGRILQCLAKFLTYFDMNRELIHFHSLRNKFCYFLLNKNIYPVENFYIQESILIMFYSCLKQNSEGLLTVEYLKRLLEFTYVYNLKLKMNSINIKEFRELKKNISIIIEDFVRISIEKKRDDILDEYFNFIKNLKSDNPYLSYKLLKFLYYLNFKELLNKRQNNNFINFCLDLVQNLDFLYFGKYNIICELEKENVEEEIKICELLKSLLIRFIDDYNIKLELPQETLKNNQNTSSYPNQYQFQSNLEKSASLKKSNFSLTSSQISQYKSKGTVTIQPNTQSQNITSHKYLKLDKLVENIIPSHYTIRSLLLTVYETPDPRLSFSYIKKNIHCDFSFFSKEALIIIIKMIENISINKSVDSIKLLSELLDYSFDQLIKFLFLIIDQYIAYSTISNKNEKDSKKIFNDLFESSKICSRLFFSCFNCYYLDEDTRKSQLESLKWIINKTLLIHSNPFYYKLILNLRSDSISDFCSSSLVTDLTNFLISEINVLCSVKVKEIYYKNVISNLKNSCILIYKLLIMKNYGLNFTNSNQNQDNLSSTEWNKSNYFQILLNSGFKENFLNFLTNLKNHQIILSRMRFNLRSSSKNNQGLNNQNNLSTTSNDTKKQKSILEMIFEILLESHKVVKEDKFLDILNDLFIWKNHTIFYYMDIYYYFNDVKSNTIKKRFDKDILKLIDSTFIKEGHIFVFLNSFHFLIKLFVNIFILEEESTQGFVFPNETNIDLNKLEICDIKEKKIEESEMKNSQKILQNLEKFAKYLMNDIVNLYNQYHKSNTVERKIKVEVKDFYYSKVKEYFENEFLGLVEDRSYDTLKNKIFEIIQQKKSEIYRYYKLNAKKFCSNSNESNINLSLNRKFSSDKEKKENIYLRKSNSEDESFTIKTVNAINLNSNIVISDMEQKIKLSTSETLHSPLKKENSDKSNHNTSGEVNYTKDEKTSSLYVSTNMQSKINSNSEFSSVKNDIKFSNKNVPYISIDSLPIIVTYNTESFSNNILYKPKKDLLLTNFSVYFKTNFFNNGSSNYNLNQSCNIFEDIRKKYLTVCSESNIQNNSNSKNIFKQKNESDFKLIRTGIHDQDRETNIEEKFLIPTLFNNDNMYSNSKSKYPVKLRNLITNSFIKPFLKPDTKFFYSKFTKISHAYYFCNDEKIKLNKNLSTNSISSLTNIDPKSEENEQIKNDDNNLIESFNNIKQFRDSSFPDNLNVLKSNFINLIPINSSKIIKPLESFKCEHIKLNEVIFGNLNIHNEFFSFSSEIDENLYNPLDPSSKLYNETFEYIFSSLNNEIVYRKKEFKIFFKDISEILIRRFLYMWQGVEIFLKNGKSYLFNLFKTGKAEQFFKVILGNSDLISRQILHFNKILNGINVVNNCKKYFKDKEFTKKWLNNELTNFEYILLLNKYSGRSYQDVNQYPVFPWIIKNYLDPKFNINDKNILRCFNYPVSIQNEEKRLLALKKFDDETLDNFKVHFRCHYSTSAFNSFYLMRINPFTNNMLKLQSDKFENPNRMFNSFRETWDILEKYNDNRELTPEFFFLPEIFLNLNLNNFGIRADISRIDKFILPPWSQSAVEFIKKHKSFLEHKIVSENIHHWIDLIFGYNQLIKTKDSLNVYPKYSYEQEVNLEKKIEKCFKRGEDENKILFKIRNKISLILNFGQTPHKILEEKHPKKEFFVKESKSDIYTIVSDMVWSKTLFLKDFNKGIRFFSSSKSFIYVLTGDKEIELIDKNKFERKSKIRLKNFLNLNSFSIKDEQNSNNMISLSNSKNMRKTSEDITKKLPIYREKYTFIEIKDCKYFLSCRHIDKSIKIYYTENSSPNENLKEILCDNLVCTIAKHPDEKLFYTGEDSGRLTKWSLEYGKNDILLSIKPIKSFIAHEDAITAMLVNEKFNIFITGGEDGYVMIRNLYDLELLVCFKIEYQNSCKENKFKNIYENKNNKKTINFVSQGNKKQIIQSNYKTFKIVDIIFNEFSSGLIYVTIFDNDKFILIGYTLNGLKFCQLEGLYNNSEITSCGNLIYGQFNNLQIKLCDPVKFDIEILNYRNLNEDYNRTNNNPIAKSNSLSIITDSDSLEKYMYYFSLLDSNENFIYYGGYDGYLKRSLFLKQNEYDFTSL